MKRSGRTSATLKNSAVTVSFSLTLILLWMTRTWVKTSIWRFSAKPRITSIFSPYLIIDNEMQTALSLAAKRGVDVRIVTPAIPDKKMVFRLTRSYYRPLIKAGVEYTNTRQVLSMLKAISAMTESALWAPSIWTIAACFYILNAVL